MSTWDNCERSINAINIIFIPSLQFLRKALGPTVSRESELCSALCDSDTLSGSWAATQASAGGHANVYRSHMG
jgi:hypothetical protein